MKIAGSVAMFSQDFGAVPTGHLLLVCVCVCGGGGGSKQEGGGGEVKGVAGTSFNRTESGGGGAQTVLS